MSELSIDIQRAREEDKDKIFQVVKNAFADVAHSDHSEHILVERILISDCLVPELSLVAIVNDTIVGYALCSEVAILDERDQSFPTLALAPIAVLPAYQNKQIGTALIQKIHFNARAVGYTSIALIGHAAYYPRFGYRKASDYSIRFPIPAPDENCMIIELIPNALEGKTGMIKYPSLFFQ